MFISDEAFAQLHQELMLEHKAKLRMITDNNKLYRILQEIKAIAEELLEKGLEPQSVEHQLRLKGKRELASIISDLITKAEEKWKLKVKYIAFLSNQALSKTNL